MTKKVNWGIIGLGKIAHKFAHDLNISQHTNLQAVASRSAEKAEVFANTFQALSFYSSYQELLNDASVDIVYLALPNSQHYKYSMLALQSNNAVLCEKPLGLNPEEVLGLQAEARRRNLFLMEGLWTRFIPATQKVMRIIEEGIIGEVISLKADFGFKALYNPNSRLFAPSLGGGSLLDIGLYPLYLSLLVLGEADNIKGFARFGETGVDIQCQMILQYSNGALAHLESSFEANTPTEAFIYGTKGFIKIHSRFHHSEKLSLTLNDGTKEDFEIKCRGYGYVHEIESVNQSILHGLIENQLLSHQESLKLAQLIARVKTEITPPAID
jgi:predicted dehydrogenase